jgi:hypothetical protein
MRRFRHADAGSRQAYDLPIWLLASALAGHRADGAPPTEKQHALLCTALFKWVANSEGQLLSQLLLQLLLLAYCVPPASELREGTPSACRFVAELLEAVNATSARTPGELTFVEVQISFVLSSAHLLALLQMPLQLRLVKAHERRAVWGGGGRGGSSHEIWSCSWHWDWTCFS